MSTSATNSLWDWVNLRWQLHHSSTLPPTLNSVKGIELAKKFILGFSIISYGKTP